MRHDIGAILLLLPIAMLPLPASADELDGSTITLQTENDRYAVPSTDRHYTNGFRASWLSPRRFVPASVGRFTDLPSLFVRNGNTAPDRRLGISVGHSIFTPEDTEARELLPDDRPYAGWAYAGLSLQTIYAFDDGGATRQDTIAIEAGVVGPFAGGRRVQNGWHEIIGVESVEGWDNQLENEPGFNLIFERKWRTGTAKLSDGFGLEMDVIPHVNASAGNVLTAFGAGATFRIGDELQSDFGPPRIRPSLPGSETVLGPGVFGWYIFGGVEGRAVAHNIFLDGNSFRGGPSVDRHTLVGDFQAGAAVVLGSVRLTYTLVWRTKEFRKQPEADRFGALSLSWRF